METIKLQQYESDILYNLIVHEIEHEEELRDEKDPAFSRQYLSRLRRLQKKVSELG